MQMQEQLVAIAIAYAPKVFLVALLLAGGYLAARWAGSAAGRALERYQLEPPVRALFQGAARVLVLGCFVIMALQNMGVEVLPLIAGIGIAGAAVALAMQGVLANVVA